MNYFDELKILGRVSYPISWLLIGVLYFVFQTSVSLLLGVSVFPATRAILTLAVISGIPIALGSFHRQFPSYVEDLESVIQPTGGQFSSWAKSREADIFSVRDLRSFVSFIVLYLFLIITVLALELPYEGSTVVAIILLLLPFALIGGQGIWVVFKILGFVHEISQAELVVDFGRPPELALHGLGRFISGVSIAGLLIYAAHFVSFVFTDFWITIPMFIWLGVIAVFPLALFGYSFFQLRQLMRRIKFRNISQLNLQIQRVFDRVRQSAMMEDAEILETLLSIQGALERSSIWPKSLGGLVTWTLTILPLAAQIAILAMEARSP